MPSPVGHAFGGVAAGWMVRGNRLLDGGAGGRIEALGFAVLGTLADLDLFLGFHRGPTHGLGTAALLGVVVWLMSSRGRAPVMRLQLGLACSLAYASHTLLDWLGTDTSPPFGIMALWPLSHRYFESNFHVFLAVSRRFRQLDVFLRQNVAALTRELLVLLPVLAAVGWMRRTAAGRPSHVPQHPQHQGEKGEGHRGEEESGYRE